MEIIIKTVIVILFLVAMLGSYVGIAIYLKRRSETFVFCLWIVVGIPISMYIAMIVIEVIAWVITILLGIPIALLFR